MIERSDVVKLEGQQADLQVSEILARWHERLRVRSTWMCGNAGMRRSFHANDWLRLSERSIPTWTLIHSVGVATIPHQHNPK